MNEEFLGCGLAEASQLVGASVPHLRLEIAQGRLKAKKNGRRVFILRSELERYVDALPDWRPGDAPKAANDARRGSAAGVRTLAEVRALDGITADEALAPLEAGVAVRSALGNDSDGSTLAE